MLSCSKAKVETCLPSGEISRDTGPTFARWKGVIQQIKAVVYLYLLNINKRQIFATTSSMLCPLKVGPDSMSKKTKSMYHPSHTSVSLLQCSTHIGLHLSDKCRNRCTFRSKQKYASYVILRIRSRAQTSAIKRWFSRHGLETDTAFYFYSGHGAALKWISALIKPYWVSSLKKNKIKYKDS